MSALIKIYGRDVRVDTCENSGETIFNFFVDNDVIVRAETIKESVNDTIIKIGFSGSNLGNSNYRIRRINQVMGHSLWGDHFVVHWDIGASPGDPINFDYDSSTGLNPFNFNKGIHQLFMFKIYPRILIDDELKNLNNKLHNVNPEDKDGSIIISI